MRAFRLVSLLLALISCTLADYSGERMVRMDDAAENETNSALSSSAPEEVIVWLTRDADAASPELTAFKYVRRVFAKHVHVVEVVGGCETALKMDIVKECRRVEK